MTGKQSGDTDDDQDKVRYVAFYDDPEQPDHIVMTTYEIDKPDETLHLFNFESETRRICNLIGYKSTGGWVPVDEAKEMTDDIADSVLDGDSYDL